MAFPLAALAGIVAGGAASAGMNQASSAISSRRNWKYRQKEMALQQQYNERNMDLQYQYQMDAWNKENAYNDPRRAVARWRAAGIAPQAIYGNSPGGAGVAGQMSTPDSSSPSGGSNVGSDHFTPTMTLAEYQAMNNQTRITDAEVRFKEAQTANIEAQTNAQKFQNSMQDLLKRAQEAATGIAEAERALKEVAAKWADAKEAKDMEIKDSILGEAGARIEKLKADKAYQEQATEKLKSDIDLISEQIKTEGSKRRNLDAQTKTENDFRKLRKALTQNQIKEITQRIRESRVLTAEGIEKLYAWMRGDRDASGMWSFIDKYVTGAGKDLLQSGYNGDIRNYLYDLMNGRNSE